MLLSYILALVISFSENIFSYAVVANTEYYLFYESFASVTVVCFVAIDKIENRYFLKKLFSLISIVSRRKLLCPDCPFPSTTDFSDDGILKAATETLAKYNNESASKQYSLDKVTRVSRQV